MAIYALNLFNVKDAEEYRLYAREAEKSLARHGGKVIALGDLASAPQGDIQPRRVMMLVEWESRHAIRGYIEGPELEHVHPHRDAGVDDFVWHLFHKIDELRTVLDDEAKKQ